MSYASTCFNTASGKHCCNSKSTIWLIGPCLKVSIPQAVSTVATVSNIPKLVKILLNVSIPQAVSTVATWDGTDGGIKNCLGVSIPQAVSTVAT